LITDRLNPPSSFIRVMLYPSRSFWNLQLSDLSSSFQRLWLMVSGLQWRDAMFPAEKFSLLKDTEIYGDRLTQIEFSLPVLLLAGIGLVVMVITRPALGAFMPVAFVCSLYFICQVELAVLVIVEIAAGLGPGDEAFNPARREWRTYSPTSGGHRSLAELCTSVIHGDLPGGQ
jgi:hypothetical protein